MPDDLTEVPVLFGDLRTIERTLDAAYGASAADDLARQYREMNSRPRWSNLTRSLESQLDRVRGYIKEAEESDGVSEE